MATQRQTLTDDPVDLVDELSLTEGSEYTLQATVEGRNGIVRVAEAATKPTVDGPAFYLENYDTWALKVSDVPVWVWSTSGDAAVSVDEAV